MLPNTLSSASWYTKHEDIQMSDKKLFLRKGSLRVGISSINMVYRDILNGVYTMTPS